MGRKKLGLMGAVRSPILIRRKDAESPKFRPLREVSNGEMSVRLGDRHDREVADFPDGMGIRPDYRSGANLRTGTCLWPMPFPSVRLYLLHGFQNPMTLLQAIVY